jgi:hypothetical protein
MRPSRPISIIRCARSLVVLANQSRQAFLVRTKLELLLGPDSAVVIIHCLLVLIDEVGPILVGDCVKDKSSADVFSITHENSLRAEIVV